MVQKIVKRLMFTENMTPPLTMKIYLEKGHKVVETHSILAFFPSRNISVLVGKTNSQKIGDFRKLLSNIELRDPAGDISTLWF